MVNRKPRSIYGPNNKVLLGDYTPEDFHNYRVDRDGFTIYVGGEPSLSDSSATEGLGEPGVEYLMADRFEMNLDLLSGVNSNRPILVKLASCGGNWEEGMQMFGAILTCPNPVTVLATKWARSMTSLIPLAADKFVIRPPAQYMYHRGTYGFSGLDQEADTENIERIKSCEMMFRIYTNRLKEQGICVDWSEREIREMLNAGIRDKIDVWLEAKEAKEWGFVDEVYDGNPQTLRATKINERRRANLLSVLNTPIKVEVKVT